MKSNTQSLSSWLGPIIWNSLYCPYTWLKGYAISPRPTIILTINKIATKEYNLFVLQLLHAPK